MRFMVEALRRGRPPADVMAWRARGGGRAHAAASGFHPTRQRV
jgi:hypothetical protein